MTSKSNPTIENVRSILLGAVDEARKLAKKVKKKKILIDNKRK